MDSGVHGSPRKKNKIEEEGRSEPFYEEKSDYEFTDEGGDSDVDIDVLWGEPSTPENIREHFEFDDDEKQKKEENGGSSSSNSISDNKFMISNTSLGLGYLSEFILPPRNPQEQNLVPQTFFKGKGKIKDLETTSSCNINSSIKIESMWIEELENSMEKRFEMEDMILNIRKKKANSLLEMICKFKTHSELVTSQILANADCIPEYGAVSRAILFAIRITEPYNHIASKQHFLFWNTINNISDTIKCVDEMWLGKNSLETPLVSYNNIINAFKSNDPGACIALIRRYTKKDDLETRPPIELPIVSVLVSEEGLESGYLAVYMLLEIVSSAYICKYLFIDQSEEPNGRFLDRLRISMSKKIEKDIYEGAGRVISSKFDPEDPGRLMELLSDTLHEIDIYMTSFSDRKKEIIPYTGMAMAVIFTIMDIDSDAFIKRVANSETEFDLRLPERFIDMHNNNRK